MASDLDQQGTCSSLHVCLQAHSPPLYVDSNPCTQFEQYGNPEKYLGANAVGGDVIGGDKH